MYADAEQIVQRATGMDKTKKVERLQMLKDPAVYPYVDPEALANSVIEEWADGDPDKFKAKSPNPMLQGMQPGGQPTVEGLPALQPKTPTLV